MTWPRYAAWHPFSPTVNRQVSSPLNAYGAQSRHQIRTIGDS